MTAQPQASAFPSEAKRPLSDHLRRLEAESIEIIREVAGSLGPDRAAGYVAAREVAEVLERAS